MTIPRGAVELYAALRLEYSRSPEELFKAGLISEHPRACLERVFRNRFGIDAMIVSEMDMDTLIEIANKERRDDDK